MNRYFVHRHDSSRILVLADTVAITDKRLEFLNVIPGYGPVALVSVFAEGSWAYYTVDKTKAGIDMQEFSKLCIEKGMDPNAFDKVLDDAK